MTVYETGCLFYGMNVHFSTTFNFCDYGYKLPTNMSKTVERYCGRHRYTLEKFSCFNRHSIMAFAIINQLRYRSGDDIADMNEKDTIWFFGLMEHYKNDFLLDVQFLVENISCIRDIYRFHVEEKIRWYTMPVLFKYLRFDFSIMKNDVPVLSELTFLYRALKIIQLDGEFFKENIEDLQKKIDLILS